MIIATIDPGKRNLAIYIECFDPEKDKPYGKILLLKVFDIRHDKKSDSFDLKTRLNLLKLLNRYKKFWNKCDFIVIEQQFFNFKFGANIDAIKIAEICYSWFLERYYKKKDIIFFSARNKTQNLDAPKGLNKNQRKKWSVNKVKELLKLKGDFEILNQLEIIEKKRKLDDMTDAFIMCQAFKLRL